MRERFWEIDSLRGLAVVMMVFYHSLFDLRYLTGRGASIPPEFWFWFPRLTAGLFIFLAGVSLAISYGKKLDDKSFAKKIVFRGAKLFAVGLLITVATFVFTQNNGTIWFGILHFIGVGVTASLLFLKSDRLAAIGAITSFAAGFLADKLVAGTPYFIWLGIKFPGFYSLDYFPLFPWLGVMLLGVLAGKKLFAEGKRGFVTPRGENNFAVRFLSLLGRRSLAIYLLHQPVLIALILLLISL